MGGAELSTKVIADNLAKHKDITVDILAHGEKNESEAIGNTTVLRRNFGISSETLFNRYYGRPSGVIKKLRGKFSDIMKNKHLQDVYIRLFSKYDVIIISGNAANMGRRNMWIAAQKTKVPMIQILRDPILLYFKDCKPNKYQWLDRVYRFFSLKNLQNVPYIVGPTHAIIELHKKLGAKLNSPTVISNTVSDEFCHIVPFSEKDNVILYVGAVSKRKGCATLISAFIKAASAIPDYKLVLVGKVEDVKIPIADNIISMGHLDMNEVYKKMAHSKLLVLPSEWEEAFGRVVVEAVFNNTIAIGSDRGGIPELFKFDSNYVFENGNIEELAKYLVKFANMESGEYQLHLRNLLNEFDRFRVERNIEQWHNYLMEIILTSKR